MILDIFSGPEAPEHIACTGFYQEAAARLTPRGVLIVNVGDEPGLTLVRSQVAAMRRAMADVSAFAEAGMFTGRYPGNIILTGTQGPWPEVWTAALTAAGRIRRRCSPASSWSASDRRSLGSWRAAFAGGADPRPPRRLGEP